LEKLDKIRTNIR